jgi:hypothetical protein
MFFRIAFFMTSYILLLYCLFVVPLLDRRCMEIMNCFQETSRQSSLDPRQSKMRAEKETEITYVRESEYKRTALVHEGGITTDRQSNETLRMHA